LERRGQYRGQQFGRRYTAAHLRRCRGPGRGADHQISGLCHIETGFGQASDDTDLPRISGSSATAENQSNIVNHLPTISARGHSCPSLFMRHFTGCAISPDDRPYGTVLV
jgi:hypothetical protein